MEQGIWILSAMRTPLGSFQGELSACPAPVLGGYAIGAALKSARLETESIDEVFMGCVLPAGCGQAPARQAALGAGLPHDCGATTINKVCGSGMKAVVLAHDLILAGSLNCAVAGGMESMTNAPHLMKEARAGVRLGHSKILDHMFTDGLEDAYDGQLMGVFAQQTADRFGFSREQMDDWAKRSVSRAVDAQNERRFDNEIVPVPLTNNLHFAEQDSDLITEKNVTCRDQHPGEIRPEKIPDLRPAFSSGGTVTAANSSSISDGAAALVLINPQTATDMGLKPLAVIRGYASHARKPEEFTIAPVYAVTELLNRLNWNADEVDLWEINEAFAVVTQLAVEKLGLDPERVNVNGGACALGHPIGASGARILVTLIHALQSRLAKSKQEETEARTPGVLRGIATICIGGGEAIAVAVEVSG